MDQKVKITLKDFEGKVVLAWDDDAPLPFAYLFHNERLFVSSRDDMNTLLERSYCVFLTEKDAEKINQLEAHKTVQ